jgi:hypothetical protein
MSDGLVARALVDAVLRDTVAGFVGLGQLEAVVSDGEEGRMAFTGKARDGRPVLVEVEARLARCEGQAGSCPTPDSAGRECGGDGAVMKPEAHLRDSVCGL